MESKIIAVDYDHTLCDTDLTMPPDAERYSIAAPHREMIKFINELYDVGHQIVIYTARGQLSCNGDLALIESKYRLVSEDWLVRHNVKFHHLLFGKMYFDVLIDDKAWNINAISELEYLKG